MPNKLCILLTQLQSSDFFNKWFNISIFFVGFENGEFPKFVHVSWQIKHQDLRVVTGTPIYKVVKPKCMIVGSSFEILDD